MWGHVRKRTHRTKAGKTTTGWYVVVDIGRSLEGKRRQKWHGGYASRAEAERARAGIVSGLHDGSYVEPTGLTVADWIVDRWLPLITKRAAATTIVSYQSILKHHVLPTIGGIRLHELNASHLDSLYTELLVGGRRDGKGGLHPRTVGNVHLLIHLAIADAQRAGVVRVNVADAAHPPRRTSTRSTTIRAWEAENLAAFLDRVKGDHLEAAWHLAALTGMRRGEIAGLRWSNVDLKRRQLRVYESRTRVGTEIIATTPKSGRSRLVDLDPATARMLRSHRARQVVGNVENIVFAYPDGRALRPDYLSERFLRLVAKTDLPRIRLHDLRHTHATMALRAGVPVHVVAERLGHANSSMTLAVYAHVLPGQQAQAANRIADLLTTSRHNRCDDIDDTA